MDFICRFCGTECPAFLQEMPCQNCGSDAPFRFIPPHWPRTYQSVKRALTFDDRSVAEIFNYKNSNALNSSTAARDVKEGFLRAVYAAWMNPQ